LGKNSFDTPEGSEAGRALENYILQELIAYNSMRELDYKINYWRTKSGLEVDFLIDERIAIEVKVSANIHSSHLNGLKALNEEMKLEKSIVVCLEEKARVIDHQGAMINIMYVENFLTQLWAGKIF
jgi:predicted AAA+ superfamily ATPase